MKLPAFALVAAFTAFQAFGQSPAPAGASPSASAGGVQRVPVVFSGGHDTDRRDHGRPVVLVAGALGVAPEVFHDAFSGVHPAGPRSGGPTDAEARANKAVLMAALGKYGVTDERLNEVSNFYRYPPGSRDLWRHKEAEANALVQNGVIIGYEIVSGGYGYTTPPDVTVPNVTGPAPKVVLSFGKDFQTNGSVSAIKVADGK